MSIRSVCFIAILWFEVSLSFQYQRYAANNAEKIEWMKARVLGKALGKKTVVVKKLGGEEVGRRPYSYSAVCRLGYVVDQVAVDESYTCKKAPGKRRRIICTNVYAYMQSVQCPGSMYVNSWWTEGFIKKIRCCGERGLSYSEDNCNIIDVKLGEPFGVSKGKYWPGFGSNDGGINWKVKECVYESRYLDSNNNRELGPDASVREKVKSVFIELSSSNDNCADTVLSIANDHQISNGKFLTGGGSDDGGLTLNPR